MTTRQTTPLDLAAVRERLTAGGKEFGRALEEVAQTEAFQEMLHREFPSQAWEWTDPPTRRRFLTLMGASLALAGLGGCAQPDLVLQEPSTLEQDAPGDGRVGEVDLELPPQDLLAVSIEGEAVDQVSGFEQVVYCLVVFGCSACCCRE